MTSEPQPDEPVELVTLSRGADGVAVLTLCRPERLNALNDSMTGALRATIEAVRTDSTIRVLILTGAGRAFCAGLDLKGYGDGTKIRDETALVRMLSRQREIAGLAQALHHLPQPVIAAVDGPAAGAGLALACASDIRVCSDDAVFAASFIRAGYSGCDIGISWLLPRIVGTGNAHELMLTGRRLDAQGALAMGLVTSVHDGSAMPAARAKAAEILLNPPLSVELTKQGMWIALETAGFDAAVEFENRQQVFTAFTADQQEAAAAFLESRPPHYQRR
jgi:enoyl-CoA hydratase/carnithine racemase